MSSRPIVASLDRRGLLGGTSALATISSLRSCAATAQDDPVEAALASLGSLEPLRPEDFGASGRRDDDQSRAMSALMVEARRRGRARILLRSDATYTCANPFIWGGIRELLIEGRGATLMNARAVTRLSTFDANLAPYRSPTPVMPNGTDPLDFGPGQGSGKLDFGVRIRSAAQGATVLHSLDGAPLPAGRLLVYGWDRYGADTVPPCPICFEWVQARAVSGRPGEVRLAAPLRFAYDERAPELVFSNDRAQRYGAVRVLSLSRRAGRFRPFSEVDLLALRDVVFAPSPRIRIAGDAAYNGVAGLGGARRIVLEGVGARRLFVNFAELVRVRRARVEEDFEIDKLVGRVEIEDSTIGSLVGALGAREVIVGTGTNVTRGTALAPLDLLEARNATFAGDASSERALIGFYAHGSRAVRLSACEFRAERRQVDRLAEGVFFSARVRRIARDELSLSRIEFRGSGIFRNLFVGATLFDEGNRAIARVVRLPWCPDGDLVDGDVRFGVEPLIDFPDVLTVRLPTIAGLIVRDERLTGPYAAQVSATFGTTPNRTGNDVLAVVDNFELGSRAIRIDSRVTTADQPGHNFLVLLGRSFLATRVRFEILAPATRPTGLLFVGAQTDRARETALLGAVEPSLRGVRELTAAGASGPPDEAPGALPRDGLLAVRIVDPSRGLAPAERARWSLMLEGSFR